MDKSAKTISNMFNSIADKYDFLNHILSFGFDYFWRKKAIQLISKRSSSIILDIATGTGDLAIEASKLKNVKIIGCDISQKMLDIAKEKIAKKNLSNKISLIEANSDHLPFTDNFFDFVMIGFGIRNFNDIDSSFKEINRVLKKGGMLCILEFSKPENKFILKFSNLYKAYFLPYIAGFFSRNKSAYKYLNQSVNAFPAGKEFIKIIKDHNFINIQQKKLTFGICSIYTGEKA